MHVEDVAAAGADGLQERVGRRLVQIDAGNGRVRAFAEAFLRRQGRRR